MDRTKFYTVEDVLGTEELDFLHNNLSDFKMTYLPGYYRVSEADLMRPDIISFKSYGTVKYWWLLCYVNEIEDPFNTLVVGMQLKIPNLIDVYDFYKQYRAR